jgi:hypothetical protein
MERTVTNLEMVSFMDLFTTAIDEVPRRGIRSCSLANMLERLTFML